MGKATQQAAKVGRTNCSPGIDDSAWLLSRHARPLQRQLLANNLQSIREVEQAAGRKIPKNVRHHKRLDCAIFQYAFAATEETEQRLVDTVRAVYVPTDSKQRVWAGSWITRQSHIQICVRNPSNILGTWLLKSSNSSEEPNEGQNLQEA
jgi:hypothetical protein